MCFGHTGKLKGGLHGRYMWSRNNNACGRGISYDTDPKGHWASTSVLWHDSRPDGCHHPPGEYYLASLCVGAYLYVLPSPASYPPVHKLYVLQATSARVHELSSTADYLSSGMGQSQRKPSCQCQTEIRSEGTNRHVRVRMPCMAARQAELCLMANSA